MFYGKKISGLYFAHVILTTAYHKKQLISWYKLKFRFLLYTNRKYSYEVFFRNNGYVCMNHIPFEEILQNIPFFTQTVEYKFDCGKCLQKHKTL